MPNRPALDPNAIRAHLVETLRDPLYSRAAGVQFTGDALAVIATAFDTAVSRHVKDLLDAADTRPHWQCHNCGEEGGNLTKPVTQTLAFCTLCAGGVTKGKQAYGTAPAGS